MSMGLRLAPTLEQRLHTKLQIKLSLGFKASYSWMERDGRIYVGLIQEKDNPKLRKLSIIGDYQKGESLDIQDIKAVIWNFWINKELHTTPLAYEIHNPQGKLIDEGYIQDQFGHGLINPYKYDKVEEWKPLKDLKVR